MPREWISYCCVQQNARPGWGNRRSRPQHEREPKRKRPHDDSATLVRDAQRNRHGHQDGSGAEAVLCRDRQQEQARHPAHARLSPHRPARDEQTDRRDQHNGRQQAVRELDGGYVLEKVHVQRVVWKDQGWHQLAIHQRKGVVGESGIGAGNEPAPDDGQQHEHACAHRGQEQRSRPWLRLEPRWLRWRQQPERRPQDQTIDQQRRGQMGDQPVLADIGPVDHAALDHQPAETALQRSEKKNESEPEAERAVDLPPEQKDEEGKEENDPISRPVSRCTYSSQKMPLNASRVIPVLIFWYSG